MKETVKMDRYTCDGCGKEVLTPHKDITEAYGYHGTVFEITETRGSGTIDWFACDTPCIAGAIVKALIRAE